MRVAEAGELRGGARAGVPPRPARDRRGGGAGPRGRVLGRRAHDERRRPASRARSSCCAAPRRAAGTTTRRSTRRAGWSSSCRRGSPRRRATGPRAGDARVPRERAAAAWRAPTSSSTATTVLLNELNTMPGFTETSVYGEALGGDRRALPGALRPARARRGRAARGAERALPVAALRSQRALAVEVRPRRSRPAPGRERTSRSRPGTSGSALPPVSRSTRVTRVAAGIVPTCVQAGSSIVAGRRGAAGRREHLAAPARASACGPRADARRRRAWRRSRGRRRPSRGCR